MLFFGYFVSLFSSDNGSCICNNLYVGLQINSKKAKKKKNPVPVHSPISIFADFAGCFQHNSFHLCEMHCNLTLF